MRRTTQCSTHGSTIARHHHMINATLYEKLGYNFIRDMVSATLALAVVVDLQLRKRRRAAEAGDPGQCTGSDDHPMVRRNGREAAF
jgi:hypothetical protein